MDTDAWPLWVRVHRRDGSTTLKHRRGAATRRRPTAPSSSGEGKCCRVAREAATCSCRALPTLPARRHQHAACARHATVRAHSQTVRTRARAHDRPLTPPTPSISSVSPPERGAFASVAALTRRSLAPCPALQRCPDRDDKTRPAPTPLTPMLGRALSPAPVRQARGPPHIHCPRALCSTHPHWTRAGVPP